ASNPREVGNKVREALGGNVLPNKKLTLVINDKPHGTSKPVAAAGSHAAPTTPAHSAVPAVSQTSRQYIQARALALAGHAPASARSGTTATAPHAAPHGGEAHWSYEGATGPQAWGQLKPEFNVCAIGKRQSPINIDDSNTLQGPAEPLQFSYTPSNASVVNNGHTIQVDLQGDNLLTVRGSRYRLLQFHFHTPSEEQINFKRSVMVAHLVHKNDEGQLAVVAVLMEPGTTNPLIDKVWTYMPLDTGDRVRMPPELLNLSELLPKDQRYYQFMGSLTTPPCTEGVLWMVMKQAVPISKSQYRLFTQLYPNNARPIQPANGRPIRDAL
ncbi:MAG: carbonic anhydrase family protein, partial [Rhodoferax sp.]|nr:carbonic anhydrase family protein [Rhodoferax sp.]